MKVFISSDIEGTTGITAWDETEWSDARAPFFVAQMTREVDAAAKGAIVAGADDVLIKDAHDSARNINEFELPENVRLIRGWPGNPWCMMSGIETGAFDAAVMTGYHSWAGSDGNPLAHTMTTDVAGVTLNGESASEFLINTYIAAYRAVPVVFLSGDANLCDYAKTLIPAVTTVKTNTGIGNASISINPKSAVKLIYDGVKSALEGDVKKCLVRLPEKFETEITYKRHKDAYRNSFYPGASLISPHTIRFGASDYYEIMRFYHFAL